MTWDVLVWAMFGLAVANLLIVFAVYEIYTYLRPGRTLSEVTEGAIRASRALWWFVLVSLLVLGLGFGVLLPLHWFTGLL